MVEKKLKQTKNPVEPIGMSLVKIPIHFTAKYYDEYLCINGKALEAKAGNHWHKEFEVNFLSYSEEDRRALLRAVDTRFVALGESTTCSGWVEPLRSNYEIDVSVLLEVGRSLLQKDEDYKNEKAGGEYVLLHWAQENGSEYLKFLVESSSKGWEAVARTEFIDMSMPAGFFKLHHSIHASYAPLTDEEQFRKRHLLKPFPYVKHPKIYKKAGMFLTRYYVKSWMKCPDGYEYDVMAHVSSVFLDF